jgi:hypothetical protein
MGTLMDTIKKKAWKTVIIGYLGYLIIVLAIMFFIYIRNGSSSLSASLTVGVFLALAGLKWVYSDYQNNKRNLLDKNNGDNL